jgi:alpha-beta hydrolase superfamily lysophospholipase
LQHQISSFQSADGLKIYTESWLPDAAPKAVVLIVHGYAEHIGRYVHVADYLVGRGYAVYGLDHRGHGRSDGLRAYFDNIDQPVDDLKRYFDSVKASHAGRKIFMYGHSMGSLIALAFALRYQDQLAGLILSGTAVNADTTVSPTLVAISGVLSRIIPKTTLTPPLPSNALSHDPAVVSAYDSDPLNYRGNWRIRMGAVLLQQGKILRERVAELTLPLFIMHGKEDAVTPVSGAEVIASKARSADKTLKIYPGLFHEIHNEPEKATILADIGDWLDKH